MLRGLARERGHWGAFPRMAASRWSDAEVETPDLVGFGSLRSQRSPLRLSQITDDLRARVRPRDTQPLRLLGLSLGGQVALDWLLRYPREVEGLVLVNTSVGSLSPPWERLRPQAIGDLLSALLNPLPQSRERRVLRRISNHASVQQAMLEAWTSLARQRPAQRRNVLRQLAAAGTFRPSLNALRESGRRPDVHVVVSLRDRLVDPRCSRRLAEQTGWPLHIHPTAGHDLPLDAPDWLLRVCEKIAQKR